MAQGTEKKRMVLLLRNSSKKQAERKVNQDGKIEYDIPLQREILTPWAKSLGYVIVREFVEGGVSGYKVSAAKRDALVEIKEMANRGEFDVLGIYMSDRLGRIADETPLVVSYLNARGIRVLSYTDGEISSRTHDEKLMTYIRYWQAEGESIKTSKRIKDAHVMAVEQGRWRGGNPPYGYRTVSKGTLNGKGRPIFDIEIDPAQAEIVRDIFRLYREHYGVKGIAKYLNDNNVPLPSGKLWSWTKVQDILHNKLYIGIYELGKKKNSVRAVSPVMDHLVIISEEEFNAVQALLKENTKRVGPLRATIRGTRLLTGLLYCECGKKYTSQTNRNSRIGLDGIERVYERTTYRCASFRTPKEGQCSKLPIKADLLDELVVQDAKNFLLKADFNKLLQSNEDSIREQRTLLMIQLKEVLRNRTQMEKLLKRLSDEVCKVIMGESTWSQATLSDIMGKKERELSDIKKRQEEIEAKLKGIEAYLSAQKAACSDISNWAERFDIQGVAEKKSMLINLIDKITVYDEKVTVLYKFRCEYLRGGSKHEAVNDVDAGVIPQAFLSALGVQGADQPSRAPSSLSAR